MTSREPDLLNLRVILECFSHDFYNPHVVAAQLQAIMETFSSRTEVTDLDDVLEVVQWYGLNEVQVSRYLTEEELQQLRLVALQSYVRQNVEAFQDWQVNVSNESVKSDEILENVEKSEKPRLFKDFKSFIQNSVKPFMSVDKMWLFVESCVDVVTKLQAVSDGNEYRFTIPEITWYLGRLVEDNLLEKWHESTPAWIKLEQVRAVFKNLPRIMKEHGISSPFCGPSCRGISITPEMNLNELLTSIKGVNE